MAFTDQKSLKERSVGMAGALALPGAMGALLITGLAVTDIVLPEPDEGLEGVNIPLPPPPPPEPKVEQRNQQTPSRVTAPERPFEFPKPDFAADPIPKIPPLVGDVIPIAIPPIGDIGPAMPSIKPAIASPRNDPGRWITTNDYRTVWINREWTGTARFDLRISANGRVTDCQITRSTGYSALDNATCSLIAKRARFEPATDASGNKVAGSYSSSIRWELPD